MKKLKLLLAIMLITIGVVHAQKIHYMVKLTSCAAHVKEELGYEEPRWIISMSQPSSFNTVSGERTISDDDHDYGAFRVYDFSDISWQDIAGDNPANVTFTYRAYEDDTNYDDDELSGSTTLAINNGTHAVWTSRTFILGSSSSNDPYYEFRLSTWWNWVTPVPQVSCSSAQTNGFTITMANAGYRVTSWQYECSTISDFTANVVSASGITSESVVITGLEPSTKYYVRIKATNENGTSDWVSSDETTLTKVSSVTSSVTDGSYNAGDIIPVIVNFTSDVTVSGTPKIELETGTTNAYAYYSNGSGTSSLIFNYTVASGNTSSDLSYVSANALTLNGGTIADAIAQTADIVLPSPSVANSLSANKNIIVDTQLPTVAITSEEKNPTNSTGFNATITFSEEIIGFTISDINIDNGIVSNLSQLGSKTYLAVIVPANDGDLNLSISAGKVTDAAGNANIVSNTLSRTIDQTAPTLTISCEEVNPSANSSFVATFTFSEAVSGFAISDITLSNGLVSNLQQTASATYTATITPDHSGSLTFYVAENKVNDAADNANSVSNTITRTIDWVAPSVVIFSNEAEPNNNSSLEFTLTFNETIFSFDASDITVLNGAVTNLTQSSALVYTATVSPSEEGVLSLEIEAGKFEDAAGNTNSVSNTITRTIDWTSPSLVISSDEVNPSANSSFTAIFTFSESVSGFAISDITLSNGLVSNLQQTASATYTATITPDHSGSLTLYLAANKVNDAATNLNMLSNTLSRTIDWGTPSVVISTNEVEPNNKSSLEFTITFNEAIYNFDTSDITVNNGTVSNLSQSSAFVYVATISPSSEGILSLSIGAEKLEDAAGNVNAASNVISRTIDWTVPTATLSTNEANPSNSSSFVVTIIYSEAIQGFSIDDLTIVNGSAANLTSSGGNSYTVDVSPSTNGIVSISLADGKVTDAAGNLNTASNLLARTVDRIKPELTVSSSEADLTNSSTFIVTFSFTEPVVGFTLDDVILNNGNLSNLQTSDYKTYNAVVTPSFDGTLSLYVDAGVVVDAAGNSNTISNTITRTIDQTSPTTKISITESDPTSSASFVLTIVFNEVISGFAFDDISLGNATVTNFAQESGLKYTATIAPSADGIVSMSVGAGVATDAAGNSNLSSSEISLLYDGTSPTIALSTLATNPTNESPFTVNITFSETVNGLLIDDFTIINGSASALTQIDDTHYSVSVTPLSNGLVSVDFSAAQVVDAAGNSNIAAPTLSLTFDSSNPTTQITSALSGSTNQSSFGISINFSADVTGFESSDIQISNGDIGSFLAISASQYTATIIPATEGEVLINIAGGVAETDAFNGNSAAATYRIIYDASSPTVEISSSASNPTNSEFTVTFTFSEEVSGFDISNLSLGNATAGNFTSVSKLVYTAVIYPQSNGDVTINVASGVASDAAANTNTAAIQLSRIYDITRPIVTISSTAVNPINDSFLATFTFSESVSGFDVTDISLTNATAGNFTAVSSTVYTATISPVADGTVTINVPAGIANDAATNTNTAATQLTRTFDATQPSVVISTTAAEPLNNSFTASFTFSESVIGFDIADISLTNATAGNFTTVSSTVYTATISPVADGTVTINVPAGIANDAATNTNTAATQLTRTYDATQPSVVISTTAAEPLNGSFTASFTFSESVIGFDIADISLTNATAGNFTVVSSTVYMATISPVADGAVTINVAAGVAIDAANNTNTAATQLMRTYDATQPSVVISTTAAEPLNSSFTASFTFSESVIGFDLADISLNNATASSFTAVGSGVYTATISPVADGTVTINVAAGVANDAATNTNTAATQLTRTYDATRPGVVISTIAAEPLNSSFTVSFTFSESVIGFDIADISLNNATASSFTAVGSSVYTATISPVANGTVTINVAGGVASDAATNTNTAATQLTRTYDATRPGVVISTIAVEPLNSSFTVSFTFSESVIGFDIADISLNNATASSFTAVGSSVYTATISPVADGIVTIDVAGGVASDAATNTNTAATQLTRTYDATRPDVVISTIAAEPLNSSFTASFTFTESVNGFDINDISLTNAIASNFTVVSSTVYTAIISPIADGIVTINVAAGIASDAATNTNTAATQLSRNYNATQPGVVIATTAAEPLNSSFTASFTFSKAVSGFDVTDISLTNATVSDFSEVSSMVYTATISPVADGVVTINVAAGVASDSATNTNTAATQFSRTYDTTQPTVVIATSAPEPLNSSFSVSFTFSEAVIGFEVTDISLAKATISDFTAVSSTVYTATIVPIADGIVTIDVAAGVALDAATNPNIAATSLIRVYDSVIPDVVVHVVEVDGHAKSFKVNFTFSEPVIGFTNEDISLDNGLLTNFKKENSFNCSVEVINTTLPQVTVSIAEGVYTDLAGNLNDEAISTSVYFDYVLPTAICNDLTITLDENGEAIIAVAAVNNGSSDDNEIESLEISKSKFTCSDIGKNTVTLTVTDTSGNIATCDATITVESFYTIATRDIEVLLNENGIVRITADQIDKGSVSSCSGIASYQLDKYEFTCNDLGDNTVTLTIVDNAGVTLTKTAIVAVKEVNIQPQFNAIDNVSLSVPEGYFQVTIDGINSGNCNESVQQVIALNASTTSNVISKIDVNYTPGATTAILTVLLNDNASGSGTILVTAQDNGGVENGGMDSFTSGFEFTINAINHAPVINGSIDQQIVEVGSSFSLKLQENLFTDADADDVISCSATCSSGTWPNWLSFNSSTETFSGVPATSDAGTYVITLTASDSYGESVRLNFEVIVNNISLSNLAGVVYTGTSPVTHGIDVVLYKLAGTTPERYDQIDVISVSTQGRFTFYNLEDGSYIVEAIVTDNAANPQLLSTYYTNANSWAEATVVKIEVSTKSQIDIYMTEKPVVAEGKCKVFGSIIQMSGNNEKSGTILKSASTDTGTALEGVNVLLKKDNKVIATTLTDASGFFFFDKLPEGEYQIEVAIPGFVQNDVIVIDVKENGDNQVEQEINFTVWEGSNTITDVNTLLTDKIEVKVFPNPTSQFVTIQLNDLQIEEFETSIYSVTGKLIFKEVFNSNASVVIDLSEQSPGIYLLRVKTGKSEISKQIIKK